ncbi:hypothetical protein [Pasteurella sp. PK-2025]|uniref:hypothetical protein n=1 Tax=unclassified Pasteurella TaxID=2621516 RepID=UPI003C737290
MHNIFRHTQNNHAYFATNTKNTSRSIFSRKVHTSAQHLPCNEYNQSETLALSLGYTEVADINAFRGRYFIKNGKKWIHNIEALRRKLNADYGRYIDDEELEASAPEGFGYDVVAYYIYNGSENSLSHSDAFKKLVQQVHIN